MKHDPTADRQNSSNEKLLSWTALLEKGNILNSTIQRLYLTPDIPYLVTKSCTDGTFLEGDVIFLEPGSDIVCPKTGRRVSPGQFTQGNLDFECVPAVSKK